MRGLILALLLLGFASAPAEAKVRCGSGTTAFVERNLRIFGVHFRTPDEFGFNEYACLGRRRPLLVGGEGSSTGTASGATPVYAFAGRFLADYSQSDGEGGPSAHVTVTDLVRRRLVSFENVACCEWTPTIRLARDGTVAVLAPGEGLFVRAPGHRARSLTDGMARDLAMRGGTVYWTEAGQARSVELAEVKGGEALMLEPVRMRRRGGACAAAHGDTIAASGSVRVVERSSRRAGVRRFACRIGRAGRFFAGFPDEPAPRIVGDRWLLARGERSARVIDSTTGEEVTTAGGAITAATLLRDGTLAWLEEGGRLLAQRVGANPFVLAASGASRIAAARRAVYWTEAGLPRVYRPASAARSASKPG